MKPGYSSAFLEHACCGSHSPAVLTLYGLIPAAGGGILLCTLAGLVEAYQAGRGKDLVIGRGESPGSLDGATEGALASPPDHCHDGHKAHDAA